MIIFLKKKENWETSIMSWSQKKILCDFSAEFRSERSYHKIVEIYLFQHIHYIFQFTHGLTRIFIPKSQEYLSQRSIKDLAESLCEIKREEMLRHFFKLKMSFEWIKNICCCLMTVYFYFISELSIQALTPFQFLKIDFQFC